MEVMRTMRVHAEPCLIHFFSLGRPPNQWQGAGHVGFSLAGGEGIEPPETKGGGGSGKGLN